jgi:peroxiredoxin
MRKLEVLFAALTLMLVSTTALAQQDFKSVEEVNGKVVGEKVENFTAVDEDGNLFELKDALEEGPVVVVFYRGQWCPICNRHLTNLQDSLNLIEKMGATVIAISPEKPKYLNQTQEKTGAEFTLIYDADYSISKSFDVLFRPEQQVIDLYNERLGADFANAQSDDSAQIPVPATFVIDESGRVAWRHFDRDYKIRATAKQILDALKML